MKKKKSGSSKKASTKAVSAPSQSNGLDPDQTLKASRALIAHVKRQLEQSKDLLVGDETVVLVMGLHQIPDNIVPYPKSVPLVHGLYKDPKVCFFAPRDGKAAKETLQKHGINIKVIGMKKLKVKYRPFEMRRKLAGSYHYFICDETLLDPLRSTLGKSFFKKNKYPIGVSLTDKDLGKKIRELRTSTFLTPSNGTTWVVKVGSTELDPTALAENVINAANYTIAKHVPGKWDNIRALHIKSEKSIALPIYSSLPPKALQVGSVPEVPKTRVDPFAVDHDAENEELRKLAEEAELDISSSFDFEVDPYDRFREDVPLPEPLRRGREKEMAERASRKKRAAEEVDEEDGEEEEDDDVEEVVEEKPKKKHKSRSKKKKGGKK